MNLRVLALLVGLVGAVCCPGCTKYYHVEISGGVKSAVDGKPLTGVKVYYSRYDDIDPLANGNAPDAVTDVGGRFAFVKKEAGFVPRTMRLLLVKDGFIMETLNIRPDKEPESYANPVVVAVVAQLGRLRAEGDQ